MIKRIYLHRYRCFENFTFDLSQTTSALIIGKNGSGKSTLWQALGLFQQIGQGTSRLRELVQESDFTHSKTDLPMRFEIDLELNQKQYQYSILLDFPANFREVRVAEETLKVDGDEIFSRQQALITMQQGTTFSLDWHQLALPVINERPGYTSINTLKRFFESMLLISPIPTNMTGFSEAETHELANDASNFASWTLTFLSEHPAGYNEIMNYLQFVMPDLASFENSPRGETGKQLRVKFHDKGKPELKLDFKYLSAGEKCYFIAALIIAVNRHRGPIFCFWDEPDNHLSLNELAQFTMELRKLSNHQGQFLATSHNSEVIRRFSDENTFVFSRKSHLEPPNAIKLAKTSYQGDLIDAIKRGEIG